MLLDELLLPDGGIIADATRIHRRTDVATVCIGVGPNGVTTLRALKSKIHQELKPNQPDDPISHYGGISLLGIDDRSKINEYCSGKRCLSDDEYFSLYWPLWKCFPDPRWRRLLMESPELNWMEIHQMTCLLSDHEAPQNRQVGRYLLFNKAKSLAQTIETKCMEAMADLGCDRLEIHLFSEMSGDVVSGCFFDVCYLIRYLIEKNQWNALIHGYLFMPDVIVNEPIIAARKGLVTYHRGAGYAAMKELDYLMGLDKVHDHFEQLYAPDLYIKTQKPPMDVCFLISGPYAEKDTPVGDGLKRAVDAVSEHVMDYLQDYGDSEEWTIPQIMRQLAKNIEGIPRFDGANRCYCSMKVGNARIPHRETYTYLAVGYISKLFQQTCRLQNDMTRDVVRDFMTEYHMREKDVSNDLARHVPCLELPEIDAAILACEPCCERGKLPGVWAQAVNDWYSQCRAIRQRNALGLTRELVDYSYDANNDHYLVGRLFRSLYKMSTNPEKGPYYAAAMLINNGQDLYASLSGEIEKAENQARAQQIQIPSAEDWIIQCKQLLINARKGGPQKRAYAAFVAAVQDYANYVNSYEQCIKTKEVLETFRRQVKDLYDSYFDPLRELLDNLHETFKKNALHLQDPNICTNGTCSYNLIQLSELEKALGKAVDEANRHADHSRFLEALLSRPEMWQAEDPSEFIQFIRRWMLRVYEEHTSKSFMDYMICKFPEFECDPSALYRHIGSDVINPVERRSLGFFRFTPDFAVSLEDNVYARGHFGVPQFMYNELHSVWCPEEHSCFRRPRKDRIEFRTYTGGIPLYAYDDLPLCQAAYEQLLCSAVGAGIHLYAATGRGDDSGMKEWRIVLPNPDPWSRRKDNEILQSNRERQAEQLFREAMECGVIRRRKEIWEPVEEIAVTTDYVLCVRNMPELPTEIPKGPEENIWSWERRCSELRKLYKQILDQMYDLYVNTACTLVPLFSDGYRRSGVPEAVCLDFFIKSPKIQELTRQEIAKIQQIKEVIKKLDADLQDIADYQKNLDMFMLLMSMRLIRPSDYDGTDCADYLRPYRFRVDPSTGIEFDLLSERRYGHPYKLYCAFLGFQDWIKVVDGLPTPKSLERYDTSDLINSYQSLSERCHKFCNARRKITDYIVPEIMRRLYGQRWLDGLEPDFFSEADRANILMFYRSMINWIYIHMVESSLWPIEWSMKQLLSSLGDIYNGMTID